MCVYCIILIIISIILIITTTTLLQAMREINDGDKLKNHVIVGGSMSDLPRLLSEMRRPLINASETAFHQILVVNEEVPEMWGEIVEAFDDVYFLRGKCSVVV